MSLFHTILIANRGEIACRIARSARQMGVRTVAVYSDADQNALHVSACDESIHIGGAAATDSYLQGDRIIRAALDYGAEAIHPGFGFLSENADFAEACAQAGLTFIGPPAAAIRLMGSKSAARQTMQGAGVPVLPGYDGDDQSPVLLKQQAQKIGYPLLIKAVAGGGGKGLRAVGQAEDFYAALQSVQRESLASFADERVLLERYLPLARHIEVQLFADNQGHTLHLFDRDCSMQRRHQKVIEEAPAPDIPPATRQAMADAAIACARAVDYRGAGTVEFLLADDGAFYFMEMNTRLQVEHPVTEMISGQDLVAWQLKVAAGEPLPLTQSDLKIQGHAIEARIYAENPEQGFLPSTGALAYMRQPSTSKSVRVDTGVSKGDQISPWYDPMIAKLICHGTDRQQALSRMRAALNDFAIIGPHTNLRFLSTLCQHATVLKGGYDTRFIEHNLQDLLDQPVDSDTPDIPSLIAAALVVISDDVQAISDAQTRDSDTWSPWAISDNWRIGDNAPFEIGLHPGHDLSQTHQLRVSGALSPIPGQNAAGMGLQTGGKSYRVQLHRYQDHKIRFSIDNRRHTAIVLHSAGYLEVLIAARSYHFQRFDAGRGDQARPQDEGSILSPMPGKVIACHVKAGETVQRAQTLMVVEAMKMEHAITAPYHGVVENLNVAQGDQVDEGDALMSLLEQEPA